MMRDWKALSGREEAAYSQDPKTGEVTLEAGKLEVSVTRGGETATETYEAGAKLPQGFSLKENLDGQVQETGEPWYDLVVKPNDMDPPATKLTVELTTPEPAALKVDCETGERHAVDVEATLRDAPTGSVFVKGARDAQVTRTGKGYGNARAEGCVDAKVEHDGPDEGHARIDECGPDSLAVRSGTGDGNAYCAGSGWVNNKSTGIGGAYRGAPEMDPGAGGWREVETEKSRALARATAPPELPDRGGGQHAAEGQQQDRGAPAR